MPKEMKGNRRSNFADCKEAGDYCGPITEYTNGVPAVFFLLPIARDADVPSEARSLHYVRMPPHKFTEEPDGSLTIRESIGVDHWHGYLTEGRWELNKSKT